MKYYDVLDISMYIINYCNIKRYNISNLRLQKILYFIQVTFLKDFKKCCFKEPIEAWDFGPVVPKAYKAFKEYGAGNIPRIHFCIVIDDDDILNSYRKDYSSHSILENDKKIIQEVIEKCSIMSTTNLVEITQDQLPWKQARQTKMNNEIRIETLIEYFKV